MQLDRIEPFDASSASEALWKKYFELDESIFREIHPDPDEQPMSRSLIRRFMTEPGPHQRNERWMVLDDDGRRMIGFCSVGYITKEAPNYEANKHIVHGDVKVAREHRRQGIARSLLQTLLADATANGASTLQVNTSHLDGHTVCKQWGGVLAIEGAENRLALVEVDWDMIQTWVDESPERAPGVTLERFFDVPEADLEAYTRLYTETMNQQPMGKLENEMMTTPESRRIQEAEMAKKGITWTTMISREPDGAISGLTEILYSTDEPHRLFQNLTGVGVPYRGRGLGKWLKAAMLLEVRQRYPDVKRIITGNADVNAPMLSINERMGFKRHESGSAYKFKVQNLCQRLGI